VLLLQSLSHRKNAHGFGELETRTNESALWSLPDVVARHPEAAAKRPTDNPSTIKGPPNDDRLKSEAWTMVPPARRQLRKLNVFNRVLNVCRKNASCV
jgi:hypothetical protein